MKAILKLIIGTLVVVTSPIWIIPTVIYFICKQDKKCTCPQHTMDTKVENR